MLHLTPRRPALLAAALLCLCSPAMAQAYTGPGVGLGALSVATGIVGSILLMLVSIVWYPVKRLMRRLRGGKSAHRTPSRSGPRTAAKPSQGR